MNFPRRSGQLPHRPEMFQTWAPKFPKANGALTGAVDDLVTAYGDFFKAHQRASVDETSTPGARLVSSAKAARKMVPVIERLNKAADEAISTSAQLATKTEAAYRPANPSYPTVMRHQEIRSYFRALPQSEKLKALEQARAGGDEDTLIALASCQPFLSGLPPEMHEHTRGVLIEAHAPQEAAAIANITEQRKLAMELRDVVLQSAADLVDFGKADELIAAASAALAE